MSKRVQLTMPNSLHQWLSGKDGKSMSEKVLRLLALAFEAETGESLDLPEWGGSRVVAWCERCGKPASYVDDQETFCPACWLEEIRAEQEKE